MSSSSSVRSVYILGSTGSIGTAALEVIRRHPDSFHVVGLAAGSNAALLAQQTLEFRPTFVAMGDPDGHKELEGRLGSEKGSFDLLFGAEEVAAQTTRSDVDLVLAAIVGIAGVDSVYRALGASKTVALANKESLVAAGPLMHKQIVHHTGSLIPVDSEHSAIFQCLQGEVPESLKGLILTASGGPFRERARDSLAEVTPEEALKHPNWSMGSKISIDSATMMNKALEVIEAHWLFDVEEENIEVIIHPQSIVHSLIRLKDESQLAQLSVPDMKGAIAYALGYPGERFSNIMNPLALEELAPLTFERPDLERFPALRLARATLRAGGVAPAVLNSANEAAVGLFLAKKVAFLDIERIVESALERFEDAEAGSIAELLDLHREVLEFVAANQK